MLARSDSPADWYSWAITGSTPVPSFLNPGIFPWETSVRTVAAGTASPAGMANSDT